MIKQTQTQTTQLVHDMEKNSLVTFALNPSATVELDGEYMTARAFDCYNWKIILNGENVIINPAMYDGDLKPVTIEGELWIIYNYHKAILYNNTKGEFIGKVTKDLDPLTHEERVAKYFEEKEAGEL